MVQFRQTTILLMDDVDSWIPFFPGIADGRAVVGRTVINKDDFKIGVCLVYDGSDAFVQIFLDVIDGNDDANQWRLITMHNSKL